jgi:hypothetical protein
MNKRWIVTIVIVVVAVVLAIVLDTMLANHRPVIIGLGADPENTIPMGSCQIVCTTSDADDDELSYNWSASGGEIDGEGTTVTWTAPESGGSYNITVTVTDGRGGEDTGSVLITVRSNDAPIITSLIADAEWTLPLNSIQVTCTASDPDEDVLSYEWTTDGGDISGTGVNATWTAPQEVGTYNITVVVKDGYGGEDIGRLPLSVNLGAPPTVEELCIAPESHRYLRNSHTAGYDYDVWKDKDYEIECVTSDTGELIYNWSCTDGEISGEGSIITWTSPNKQSTSTVSIDITITVIVSDNIGNSVGKYLALHIPTCTCGSWILESGCK